MWSMKSVRDEYSRLLREYKTARSNYQQATRELDNTENPGEDLKKRCRSYKREYDNCRNDCRQFIENTLYPLLNEVRDHIKDIRDLKSGLYEKRISGIVNKEIRKNKRTLKDLERELKSMKSEMEVLLDQKVRKPFHSMDKGPSPSFTRPGSIFSTPSMSASSSLSLNTPGNSDSLYSTFADNLMGAFDDRPVKLYNSYDVSPFSGGSYEVYPFFGGNRIPGDSVKKSSGREIFPSLDFIFQERRSPLPGAELSRNHLSVRRPLMSTLGDKPVRPFSSFDDYSFGVGNRQPGDSIMKSLRREVGPPLDSIFPDSYGPLPGTELSRNHLSIGRPLTGLARFDRPLNFDDGYAHLYTGYRFDSVSSPFGHGTLPGIGGMGAGPGFGSMPGVGGMPVGGGMGMPMIVS
ncbi:MAG: hypothetical protein ACOCWZ_11635 [Spirochaetota bacterium]